MAYSNELYHHGIKGQKWGVRRTPAQLGHDVMTKHRAKKDAKEFARAKMYYGEGAGNRRKLIKATVKERSKDPLYKQEFDKALAKQDMAKHASKARTERRARDAANFTTKTGRSLINIALGNTATISASAAVIYGAYQLAKRTGADRVVKDSFNQTMNSIRREYGRMSHERQVKAAEDALRRMGIIT